MGKKRAPSYSDIFFGGGNTGKKSNWMNKNLSNGTNIYGPSGNGDRYGNKHGHRGKNFDRSPFNAMGATAVGRFRDKDEHKKKYTDRW